MFRPGLVNVQVDNGVGNLSFDLSVLSKATNRVIPGLVEQICRCSAELFSRPDVHRLQTVIPEGNRRLFAALVDSGFRQEGRLRSGLSDLAGNPVDGIVFARTPIDSVGDERGRSSVLNSILPTKRVISHVVFRNQSGEVLLLNTTYKIHWELPGGVVEHFETPRLGAIREVKEELGIDIELSQPGLIDWMPEYLGWDDALEFIFDGGILKVPQEGFAIPNSEIKDWRWVAENDLDQYLLEVAANRVRTHLANLDRLVYTENGLPVK